MLRLLAPMAMPLLRFATRAYVAGPTVADAVGVATRAAEQGMAVTFCYWNEGGEDPLQVLAQYLAVLRASEAAGLDGDLAIKIPGLWNRPDLIEAAVRHVRAGKQRAVIDSHDVAAAETTFSVVRQLGANRLGCAMPGRWQRSLTDADHAVEIGLDVRIVKGQWPDPDNADIDPSEGFLRLVDRLAGRARHVGVATHDAPLAEEALRRLQAAGTPCELELLYGLSLHPALEVARKTGVNVRLYVPFGTAWLPYSISRAKEDPRLVLRLLRDLARGRSGALPRPKRA